MALKLILLSAHSGVGLDATRATLDRAMINAEVDFVDTGVNTYHGVGLYSYAENFASLELISRSYEKRNMAIMRDIFKTFSYIRNKGEDWTRGVLAEYFLPLYRSPVIDKPVKPPTKIFKAVPSLRGGFFILPINITFTI